jgi:hypothetical protein
MRANKAATATSGPTTNIRRFVLRSAKWAVLRWPIATGGRLVR